MDFNLKLNLIFIVPQNVTEYDPCLNRFRWPEIEEEEANDSTKVIS